jgi:hypothetical protein
MSRLKEQREWDVFSKHAAGRLLLHRVENSVRESMPDVIGENRDGKAFWLELKALYEWPKRATTKPLRGAFEKGQIPFGKEWIMWGGNAYVLLRVGQDEWFLLSCKPRIIGMTWPENSIDLADMTRDQINSSAVAIGLEPIIEFLEQL